MLRLTETIRNRRTPRHQDARDQTVAQRFDREQSRDISRLYTSRIWL